MEIKLAKETLRGEEQCVITTFDEMYQIVNNGDNQKGITFYLDRDNSEKVIKKMESFFKNKNYSVLTRELKYSMDIKDYIYEVHIL